MKFCIYCNKIQEINNFYNKSNKCKACIKITRKVYRKKNKYKIAQQTKAYQKAHKPEHLFSNRKYYLKTKDKKLAYQRQYRLLNKDKLLIRDRLYNKKNKEKRRQQEKQWRILNRGAYNCKSAKRRAAKLQRTPKWLTQLEHEKIKEYYLYAQFFTESLEVSHDVDHIIPLQGKNISGLHVPENLQILAAKQNDQKGNKWPYEVK